MPTRNTSALLTAKILLVIKSPTLQPWQTRTDGSGKEGNFFPHYGEVRLRKFDKCCGESASTLPLASGLSRETVMNHGRGGGKLKTKFE